MPHQEDLDEFLVLCFQIGKKADFLQAFHREILGFVHHQNEVFALCGPLEQVVLKTAQKPFLAVGRIIRQLHVFQNSLQEFFGLQGRCHDQGGLIVVAAQIPEQDAQEHGLADPGIAHQHQEPFPPTQPVADGLQRGPVPGRREKIACIRSQPEGIVLESEKLQVIGGVHRIFPMAPMSS